MTVGDDGARNEYSKALRDQREALRRYHEVQEKYFPFKTNASGEEIKVGEPITSQVFEEIKRVQHELEIAETAVTRARNQFLESLRP